MGRYAKLKEAVCEANRRLGDSGLVELTWGNASGADRDEGVFAIKPSGVDYGDLVPDAVVVLRIDTGEVVEGDLRPSSDTATHRLLIDRFAGVGGVVHTHSLYATAWAQAQKPLVCMGTTHADHFRGPVPVARKLSDAEIDGQYEHNTGLSIIDAFTRAGIRPLEMPAVLVPGHGPFTWGASVEKALENAVALEFVARLNLLTEQISGGPVPLPLALRDRHFLRKHGAQATYGQG